MQVYESLGIPVDRQVVEQYLQLPQVASDFANYLQLYDKYKQVYRVDELLSGTWSRFALPNCGTRRLTKSWAYSVCC